MPTIIKDAFVKTSLIQVQRKRGEKFTSIFNIKIEVSRSASSNEVYSHIFDETTDVVKMLNSMDFNIISDRMNGGSFVIDDGGKIVDFRFGDYRGCIRSQDQIDNLAEEIGFSSVARGQRSVGGDLGSMFSQIRHNKNGVFFGGKSDNDVFFDVEGLKEGGEFKNNLIYRWSPFEENVEATVETERLVCTNGMFGMSPLVTKSVPIINDIGRHLKIMEAQLNPQMSAILRERFAQMLNSHASVADVKQVLSFIYSRIASANNSSFATSSDHDMQVLKGLANSLDLSHLSDVIDFSGELSGNMESVLPSGISQFDLFNVATEMSTHTSGSSQDNSVAQKFINSLVFDKTKNSVVGSTKFEKPPQPNRIFFGQDD